MHSTYSYPVTIRTMRNRPSSTSCFYLKAISDDYTIKKKDDFIRVNPIR